MNQREKELLSNYYDTDFKNKRAKITLVYNSIDDFLDTSIESKKYIVRNDVFIDVEEKLKRLPQNIKCDIDIKINDYKDYNKYNVLGAFNDQIELNHYRKERKNKIKFLQVGILLMVGILVLFFNAYVQYVLSFYNQISKDIFKEVFDIIAWVFVWESVTIMFLSKVDLPFDTKILLLKIKTVSLIDSTDNKIYDEDLLDIIETWDNTSRIKKISDIIFLVSGIAFVTYGLSCFIRYMNPDTIIEVTAGNTISIGWDIFANILVISSGLVIVLRYLGYSTKITRIFLNIVNTIVVIITTIGIFATIYSGSLSGLRSNLIEFAIIVAYVLGIILEFIYYKNKKLIDAREKKIKEKVIETINERINK